MSRGTKKRGLAAAICLAAGFALLAAAAHIPGFSQWYVTTLYPLYVGSVGRLSGTYPKPKPVAVSETFILAEFERYILAIYGGGQL